MNVSNYLPQKGHIMQPFDPDCIEQKKSKLYPDIGIHGNCITPLHPERYLVEVGFDNSNEYGTYICEYIDVYEGDFVRVSGPMQDKLGMVKDVIYYCKIRPSKYERVIAKVDTDVFGDFQMLEHMWVTYDTESLHREKIRPWFLSPLGDGPCIPIHDFAPFPAYEGYHLPLDSKRAERGELYFKEERVVYICIDKTEGYAIVRGSEYYEVTFTFESDNISGIACTCYCEGHCKHEYAVILELERLLYEYECMEEKGYTESHYLAALDKSAIWNMSMLYQDFATVSIKQIT